MLLVSKLGLPVDVAVRPPLALDLAAKALYFLDPWSGCQADAIDYVLTRARTHGGLAHEIADSDDARWWFESMDRLNQVWLGTSWDAAPVVAPLVSDPHYAAKMQLPRSWFTTSTDYSGRSAVHALLAHQAGDWDPAYPLSAQAIQIDVAARVFEINAPEDWHFLAASYPLEAAASGGLGDASLDIVPDWNTAASDWDGIHLSFGGFLLSAFVDVQRAGKATRLWRWESESTLWLREVFTARRCLEPLASRPTKMMHFGRLPGLLDSP